MNSSPELVAPVARTPNASVAMHDRYFEDAIGRNQKLKNLSDKTSECGWRVSVLNANSFHAVENHVFALNNLDAFTITKGGFCVGAFGIENELGKFASAFRALPAVKFDDVEALSDPVRVRQKVVDGQNYIYVLNRLPYPVVLEMDVAGRGSINDLVSGESIASGKSRKFNLQPYELRSFCGDTSKNVVVGGNAFFDEKYLNIMKEDVAKARNLYDELLGKGVKVAHFLPYLEFAEKCLSGKRYARLYFLLQETWRISLQVLSDEKLQAFFSISKDYTERQLAKSATVNALRAKGKIEIDGNFDEKEWAAVPECTDMSDFIKCQGNMLAKPASEKMSMRIMYDDNQLYFAVRCDESEPEEIVRKEVRRDGALWSGDDAVEIFLSSPQFGKDRHVHLAINASGGQTDLLDGKIGWNARWKAASLIDAKGWQAEVAVPFSSIQSGLGVKSGWAVNIARTRRDKPKSALVGDATYEWKNESRFAKIKFM